MAYKQDGVEQIEVNELIDIIENKPEDTILLDVRENDEYIAGHIPGVKLLPTSEFVERYEKELDPENKYIVICRSGSRSQNVCMYLQQQGFNTVTNYAGGMLEWMGELEKDE